jgi:hypothetical protein
MMSLTLPQRIEEDNGLPGGSGFIAWLEDGSSFTEAEVNWSEISKLERVDYFGMKKQVMVCTFPVKRVRVFHEGLVTEIEIPEDCSAYQAIRSGLNLVPSREPKPRVLGRCIGIVKNGEVIEERFLNGVQGEVLGMRK